MIKNKIQKNIESKFKNNTYDEENEEDEIDDMIDE